MSPHDVSKALAEAKALVVALERYDGTEAQHQTLLSQAGSVRRALEQPYDTLMRVTDNLSLAGAVNVLIKIKALEKLPESGSISAAGLATQCKTDESVITRCMRVLLLNGIAIETGPGEYAHNAFSKALYPTALGGFICLMVDVMKTWAVIPNYIKTHKPQDLYDLKKSPFVFAAGQEGKTYYEFINEDAEERHIWNHVLQNMDATFPVLGMFPFSLLKDAVEREPDRPFVVDVGGGRGQALRAIEQDCNGGWGGRLILQDLPIVIDSLEEEEIKGIEPMAYDIFTPQPVKNAHIYFMRRLLHDFYDPVCIEILRNTVSAMGPTSRLIICDMLIPESVEVGGAGQLYWMDLALMTMGGKERTLGEFQNLLRDAGLEIVKIHPSSIGSVVMVETRLPSGTGAS